MRLVDFGFLFFIALSTSAAASTVPIPVNPADPNQGNLEDMFMWTSENLLEGKMFMVGSGDQEAITLTFPKTNLTATDKEENRNEKVKIEFETNPSIDPGELVIRLMGSGRKTVGGRAKKAPFGGGIFAGGAAGSYEGIWSGPISYSPGGEQAAVTITELKFTIRNNTGEKISIPSFKVTVMMDNKSEGDMLTTSPVEAPVPPALPIAASGLLMLAGTRLMRRKQAG